MTSHELARHLLAGPDCKVTGCVAGSGSPRDIIEYGETHRETNDSPTPATTVAFRDGEPLIVLLLAD